MPKIRPLVREMVREALEALGGRTTNSAVREWILNKYPGTNKNSISSETMFSAVNHQTRVYSAPCGAPRNANDERYDFAYRPESGKLELYDRTKHGVWEIYRRVDGRLKVRRRDGDDVSEPPKSGDQDDEADGGQFAREQHLRDYLAANLERIEKGLRLYADDEGTSGVEYRTPVGTIDILAIDGRDEFVVIELKLSKGPDAVAGQVLRYKNWVKQNLADGTRVRGMIIAGNISDRIKFAVAADTEVSLKEYEVTLQLRDVVKPTLLVPRSRSTKTKADG